MQDRKANKTIFNQSGGNAYRKKIVFCIFAVEMIALFLVFLMASTVYAADQILVIDANHKYEGMDKTYSQGYKPQVNGSDVFICLPLVVSEVYGGTIQNEQITVKPDIGDIAETPFKPGDYGKTVRLAKYAATDENGGRNEIYAYYITLNLPVQPGAINGKYPVVFLLSYVNDLGESIQQSFTVYVEKTGGIQPTPTPSGGQTVEETGLSPGIVVSRYRITPEVVPAGSPFSVDITLQNTSGTGGVSNIVVSYSGVTGDIVPNSGANTFFVSGIGRNSEQNFHFKMNANADTKTSEQKIILKINYTDENGVSRSASSEIPVEVKQPIRIKYDPPSIPVQVHAGETVSASINIYNQGRDPLYNVAVSLSADGFTTKADTFVGNIEPGGSKTAGIKAKAGNEPGEVNGKLVVWYGDGSGEQYSEEVPFTTRILYRAGISGLSGEWAVLVWGAVAAAVTVSAYMLRKLIHKKINKKDKERK